MKVYNDKSPLTVEELKTAAAAFIDQTFQHHEPSLYGVTDGKTIGTYLEYRFKKFLRKTYYFEEGSAAKGIDFPTLNVDIKTTARQQPQSSSPFKSARQKIYGLGYSLLIFVYEKIDVTKSELSRLKIHHSVFVDASRTADYQMTRGIRDIIERDGNVEDLLVFMNERNLPGEEADIVELAHEVLSNPPELGYLTISNALQWRLQYQRVIENADVVHGVFKVR